VNVLLQLGWRGLSRNRRFTLLFIVNLALGLAGFLVIGSFGNSLHRHLDGHLREMLTADLVLQSSRTLTEQEVQTCAAITGPGSRFAEQVAFYSMVKGPTIARLAQIVAVDGAYPLYGTFRTEEAPVPAQVMSNLQQKRNLLMSRETARSFGVGPGAILKIGQAEYEAASFFDHDPSSELTTLALAPKIYLGLPQLHASGLIRFGSRITYKRFIRLPAAADAAQVFARLNTALAGDTGKSSDIQVVNTLDINRRLGRIVAYFSSFLGFASMVSLFLSGMAAAYLFREHLHARVRETAIMLSLGASRRQCLALSAAQVALLGLAAAGFSIFLAWLLLPFFGTLFTGLIPAQLVLAVDPASVLVTLLVGTVGSLLFCLPVYLPLLRVRPLYLLQQGAGESDTLRSKTLLLLASIVPGVLMLTLLAISLSGSLKQGAVFTAGLGALILLFSLTASLLLGRCRRWSQTSNLSWKIVWRNLYRNRVSAIAVFVAIATVMLLVNLVPQIEKGLVEEIAQPKGLELPVFFLVDIQEEQRQPLCDFFQETGPVLSPLAPMIQGRIASVNAVPFAQWQSQRQGAEQSVLRRTAFNFSSREQLDATETVVKGPPMSTLPWSEATRQPFEISIEQQFSERLGVTIGDLLVLDIQGIELEGRIVNLRKVRWNSFQPNFFMLLQKGVLDDAPKTWLASVSRIGPEGRQAVLNRLVEQFPNISVIDVTRTVAQLESIAGKLTSSLRFMGSLALATGLIVVGAIARQEALRREREINLLRVLGAGIGRIRTLVILEFGFLGGAAALVAILVSYGCASVVAWLMFDAIWVFQWRSGLLLLAATPLICAVIALWAADSVIRRKPSALLG
jgi:putative ABC transport system permease protein